MVSLKDLVSKVCRDRKTFPGVVVPLANGTSSPDRSSSEAPAPSSSPSPEKEQEKSIPDAEKKHDDSNADDRLATATLQETGNRYVSQRTTNNDGSSNGLTLESLRAEVETDISASGLDSAYDRKAKVINLAIQDIGMGRYQWELYVLCGLGWVADK